MQCGPLNCARTPLADGVCQALDVSDRWCTVSAGVSGPSRVTAAYLPRFRMEAIACGSTDRLDLYQRT
jgi:hypothetical protein